MEMLEAKFRAKPVLLLAASLVAASLYFYFAPPIEFGRTAGHYRTEEGLTIIGWLLFVIGCLGSLISTYFAARTILGLPAINYDGRILREFVFPFRHILISDIKRIEVGETEVLLYKRSGGEITINVRLVKDHRTFFDQVILN